MLVMSVPMETKTALCCIHVKSEVWQLQFLQKLWAYTEDWVFIFTDAIDSSEDLKDEGDRTLCTLHFPFSSLSW